MIKKKKHLKHTIAIGKRIVQSLPPARKEPGQRVAVLSRFGRTISVILVMDVRNIYYYEIFAESEKNRLTDNWHDSRTHAVHLLNARPHWQIQIISQSKL